MNQWFLINLMGSLWVLEGNAIASADAAAVPVAVATSPFICLMSKYDSNRRMARWQWQWEVAWWHTVVLC